MWSFKGTGTHTCNLVNEDRNQMIKPSPINHPPEEIHHHHPPEEILHHHPPEKIHHCVSFTIARGDSPLSYYSSPQEEFHHF